MTAAPAEMTRILDRLEPGGVLIAQGPLQGNGTPLTWSVQLNRRLTPRREVVAPEHVLLATTRGQREFFARLRLQEVRYETWADAWPAPATLSEVGRGLRRRILFALGQATILAHRAWPSRFATGYLYVGRKLAP